MELRIELPEIKLEEVISALQSLRKRLHEAVDGAWAKPEMLDAKDALEKIARETGMADCLRELWEKGEVNVENYRSCVRDKGVPTKYKKAWGKPVGGS